MANANCILVEVVFAQSSQHHLETLELPRGTTLGEALTQSDIPRQAGLQRVSGGDVGVFSRKVGLDYVLNDGDRVEIYRPLLLTPNEIRKLRAQRRHQSGC